MKKFDGILLCTDLDGTLLRNDKSISQENLDAIEYFKSEGGYFTFVTGRMPYFVKDFYDLVRPNAPIGCINGGGIYDYETETYLFANTLPFSVMELVEFVEASVEGIGIQINTLERIYFSRDNEANQNFRRWAKVENLTMDYHDVTEPIGKILFVDNDNEKLLRVAKLLKTHPRASEFDFVRSEKTLSEILPQGTNKGAVLAPLAERLGVEMSRTVAVGD